MQGIDENVSVVKWTSLTQATSPLTPPPADTDAAQRRAWLAYISWQVLAQASFWIPPSDCMEDQRE